MTIELRNVTKKVRLGSVRLTYEDLNLTIEGGAHVALLGHKEAGLEAIVNLICAADAPDKGVVTRSHSISWPLPAASFLSKHVSLTANANFIARLYEVDEKEFAARVGEVGGIAEFMNVRGDMTPSDVRRWFCFAIGICLPFDQYILTGTNIGKKADRPRVDEILEDLRGRAGLIVVTSQMKTAQQLCEQAYVFDQGNATFYDDMEAAAEHFDSIVTEEQSDDDFMDAEPELENLVNTEFGIV
jgi:capsular polysaccharide transport system ATP-binding protein